MTGRWAESLAAFAEIPEDQIREAGIILSPLTSVLEIRIHRGDLRAAEKMFDLYARLKDSADIQERSCYLAALAALRRGQGRYGEAFEAAREAIEHGRALSLAGQPVKQGVVEGVEAALALGDGPAARPAVGLTNGVQLQAGHRSSRRERERQSLRGFTSFRLSKDGRKILVVLSSRLYVIEREYGRVTELPGQNWIDHKLPTNKTIPGNRCRA